MGGVYVAEFEKLKYQLGLVKDELSPFGWVQYDDDYKEKKYTERRLRKMQEEEDLREDTPRWKVRWDRLMLCEHLKKKLVVAHRTFTEAGSHLMSAHEVLVKDFSHCHGFVDAITRIPSSTNDEVELLSLRIDELKEQKKEVDDALDKLVLENRRKKENRLAKSEREMERALLKRILTTLCYQNQRRAVLDLRSVRATLESDLEQSKESNKDLHKQFEAAQDAWDKQREALQKELARYKALHEKHQREAERTLRELEKTKNSSQKAADQLEVLLKEKQALLYKMATLEDQIDSLSEQLGFANRELERKEEECQECRQKVEELNSRIEELADQIKGLEEEVQHLEGEVKLLGEQLVEVTEQFREFREHLMMEHSDIRATLWQTRENAEQLEAELREEIQDGLDREDALACRAEELEDNKVSLTVQVEETEKKAAEEIAATKKWAAEEIKRKQEELERQYADERRKLITTVHILTKEVEPPDAQLRPLNPQSGSSDVPAEPAVFKKTNVCLHCRRYLVHNGVLDGDTGKPTGKQSWEAAQFR